jgi:DNA-binding CsgD family transcriptional regulator
VRRLATEREAIAPVPMKIAAAHGERRDVTLVVIAIANDQLVHCVIDSARQTKLRGFIDRVALRTRAGGSPRGRARRDVLTGREREVLSLLAQDFTQQEIAERLGVSYVTVRNHVQHILVKLGVHSILEAIAVSLIDGE